jgi:hypothetical protein
VNRSFFAATTALVLMTGTALAQTPPSVPGSLIMTPRGSAVVTGHVGSMATTTMPGFGGQGLLMGNGNGTSTLVTPGGVPEVVPTPR